MKRLLFIAGAALIAAGCRTGSGLGAGWTLPEGSRQEGKAAFVSLQCHTCHMVVGEPDLPPPSPTITSPVVLGGRTGGAMNYSDLVTAIVHPSRDLSPQLRSEWMEQAKLSPMGSFNHVMTVDEMIDLVAYLQPKYNHSRQTARP